MTTTAGATDAARATRNGDGRAQRPMPVAPPVRAPRGRRRPGLIALGVALIAVGALASAWLVSSSSERTSVLIAARDIPYGAVVSDADLAGTDVAVDAGVAVVPASERDALIGQVASSAVPAGWLLAPGQISPAAPPAAGQVLVGLPLKSDRLPAGGLAAGDRILVVDTPPADADPPTGPPATLAATVVRVGPVDLNGVSVVDVTVSAGDGPALAARAATGRIAIVVQPRGTS
jgi:hypothetical protein